MIYVIFLIPIIMIITGYIMYKYPPKKINYIVGYRTTKSMKNKKNWTKANKECGKLWLKLGIITLILSLIIFILLKLNVFKFTEQLLTIITIIQLIILLVPIPIVEKRIDNK